MANAYDYVAKFGKLKFEQKPFNEVDNLVFSLLTYLDFSGTRINENTRTLEEVGREYLAKHTYKEVAKLGIAMGMAYEMLQKVVDQDRYRRLVVSDYIYDTASNKQFCVMTFHLTKNLDYIAFEGTDQLISGWREDFELAWSFPVPSHIEAVKYLNDHVHLFGPNVIIGGHSKGGNLALVGAMYMKPHKLWKVKAIYNNDGPGLRKKEFESREYDRIKPKYIHIVPHCSIVGMMMRNDIYKVVKSEREDIVGHSLVTWEVVDDHLRHAVRSEHSKEIERRLWQWLDDHNDEERRKVTEAVFNTIEGCDILDTMALFKFKNMVKLFRQSKELDKESKDLVIGLFKMVAVGKR